MFSGITVFLFQITPSGFIPNEEDGIILPNIASRVHLREHGKYCEGIRLYN
jgi:hypothetical protein